MSRLNPATWIVWSGCAAGAALLTRNPWLLLGLGLVAVAVNWRRSGEPPGKTTLILVTSVVVSSTLLNLFFSRAGDTVLLRLPLGWFGGPYTLEGLAFGISAGLQVGVVLLVMTVFSQAVTAADLLRRTPRGLYPVGVAATLGLSFAPQARRSFVDLQEARQLRGLPAPSWKEAPRLLTPMVVMALERAVGQAEALAARGWARPWSGRRWQAGLAWAAVGAAVLLCAAEPDRAGAAVLLLLGAAAAYGMALGRRATLVRSSFDGWGAPDTLVCGLAAGAMVALLALAGQAAAGLSYYPYPMATWPALHPAPLAAIALLAAPAAARHA